MAKYTELLSEYIEHGGQLPTVFKQITDFEQYFIGRYCDCEIGFETPILFQIKLETKANLVIPAYAKRIAEFEEAQTILTNPTKTRTKTGEIDRNYGARNTTDTNTKNGEILRGGTDTRTLKNADKEYIEADLPFAGVNESEATTRREVNKGFTDTDTLIKNDNESYNNYEDKTVIIEQARTDKEIYNEVKETETGYTPTEAGALFKALEEPVKIIIEECLNEFKNLFMKVY